ncbi:AsmA-like C-terminal region-containing protein [Rhodopirellula sp. MGV]|uniref:AsmA-like C-terminal region-containing protein n=1 Tax=Rhodopirellula sp. MGV TaxID=2023130 RepID=UPI00117A31BD|nr:AsmA-like C-terminal region-containing protein [Rhodopirellula sp. MGV]
MSRWMVAVLLIAAIVFVVRFIGPQTVGNQVRRHVQKMLREQYPGLDVTIGHGRVEPNIGLILEDVRFGVPPDRPEAMPAIEQAIQRLGLSNGPSRELLRIDRVVVFAKADFSKLLEQQNPLMTERVLISGLRGHAWMESDDEFSLERLWPPPKFSDAICPRMELRNAQLTLETQIEGSRPIQLDVSKAVMLKHAVNPASGAIAAEGDVCSTVLQAIGSSSLADRFALQMSMVGTSGTLTCDINGARIEGGLIDQLPAVLRDQVQQLEHARGLKLNVDTKISAGIRGGKLAKLKTQSKIHEGSFQHPTSVMPVQGIRGMITGTLDEHGQAEVRFDACQGYWGEARMVFGGEVKNDPNRQGIAQFRGGMNVSVYDLVLDQRFAAVIPEKLKDGWKKLEPSGVVDIPRARFDLVDGKVETEAEILCKGVDVNFDKFPYPVRQLSGTVTAEHGRLKSSLMSGRVGGRLMQCLFDFPMKPLPNSPKVFSAAMDGPIAINNDLLNALTPRGESTSKLEHFIRSLNPLGGVHLVRGTLRTDDDGTKHRDFELKISDGTLRYDLFPYPLHNVTGQIRVVDEHVRMVNFQGANSNGGLIQCDGVYRMPETPDSTPDVQLADNTSPVRAALDSVAPAGGNVLELHFDAISIALDEALRRALPESSQEAWDHLAPSGMLDQLKIDVHRGGNSTPLDLSVVARQYDHNQIGAETLRLQPRSLPYRLDITQGMVRYDKGSVYIDSLHAEHGGSSVSADGSCKRIADGRWLLAMDVHNGSRLVPDAEFAAALPEQMRAAVRELNLRGPVGLSGLTETLLSDATHPEPVFGWDLKLQLEGNRIGDVGPVHSLRGELDIRGRKDSTGISAQGEVRVDSMHVNDLQITQIRGPFQIRDEHLRLGVRQSGDVSARPIEGKLFDGSIGLDGTMTLSDASFNVRLALVGASVPVVLADIGQAEQELSGTLDANMTLEGLLGTRDLLRGRGKATIEDANLYQLPVLVQLLNVLSITPNEESAFTNAEIDYTLIEDQVEFNNLKLWGSLIALHGSGTMDRRKNIDLTFNTRVSPRNTFTRILRPLAADRYTLWTVEVTGPANDPTIQRKALENVGLRFEKLFEGMNPPRDPKRKDRTAGVGRMLQ